MREELEGNTIIFSVYPKKRNDFHFTHTKKMSKCYCEMKLVVIVTVEVAARQHFPCVVSLFSPRLLTSEKLAVMDGAVSPSLK